MKNLSLFAALLISCLLCSCTDDEAGPEALIDPADANALSEVLILPQGT